MRQDDQLGGVLGARFGEQLVECGAQVGGGELGGDGDVAEVAVLGDDPHEQPVPGLNWGAGRSGAGTATCWVANRRCTITGGLQRGGQ